MVKKLHGEVQLARAIAFEYALALASGVATPIYVTMNLLSILIGLFAFAAGLLAFLPLFGWMYWLILPVALVGLLFGVLSTHRSGRNINLLVIVVGVVRLALGHGIF